MSASDKHSTVSVSGAPSSRSVVHMTTEQIYRKRASDRRCQRDSRKAKKGRIQELEDKVTALSTLLEASENERARLAANEQALIAALNNTSSKQIYQDLSITHSTFISSHLLTPDSGHGNPQGLSLFNIGSSFEGLKLPVPTLGPSSIVHTSQELSPCRPPPIAGSLLPSDSLIIDDTDEFERDFTMIFASLTTLLDQDIGGFDINQFDQLPLSCMQPSRMDDLKFPPYFENQAAGIFTQPPVWAVLPRASSPVCNLDRVTRDLVNSRTPLNSKGENTFEFSSAVYPSVASLLNPAAEATSHPVSTRIVKDIIMLMTVSGWAERIAATYVICILVRWKICPTNATYASLPEFLKPTTTQLTVPHPAWVDTIIWPEARDQLIRHMDHTKFETFRHLASKTVCVNWPYKVSEILLAVSDNNFIVNPKFEQHIQDVNNWSYGQEVVDSFPFLDGAVKVR